MQLSDPLEEEYVPSEQLTHVVETVAAMAEEEVPAAQLWHVDSEVAAVILEYLPVPHAVRVFLSGQ